MLFRLSTGWSSPLRTDIWQYWSSAAQRLCSLLSEGGGGEFVWQKPFVKPEVIFQLGYGNSFSCTLTESIYIYIYQLLACFAKEGLGNLNRVYSLRLISNVGAPKFDNIKTSVAVRVAFFFLLIEWLLAVKKIFT